MAKLTIIGPKGKIYTETREGELLSRALMLCGMAPDMPCGGRGRCGKCRVRASGALSPVSDRELEVLSADELKAGIRLACRTKVMGDAEVEPGFNRSVSKICVEGTGNAMGSKPLFRSLGAAVDIGTSTLAVRLYDRRGLLGSASAPNPQRVWGADVISRVGAAMQGESAALAASVRKAVAGLLTGLAAEYGRKPAETDGFVLTGNTAMLHLLTCTDPSPLAASPFEARELFGRPIPAQSLDLPCAPDAQAYLPRCMSAFVGADTTTALIASGICEYRETAMLVDIGTNGETALWKDGELICCSTAAGPAFEGAALSQGMQGAAGAIDHVWVGDGKVKIHVIGNVPASGICGSGVADLLACLLDLGVMDETGRLANGDYPLANGVKFTQKDVRQVQLAKSAIRSGMETLIHRGAVKDTDISVLAIAGGFGSYLSIKSAAAIGLIPPELKRSCRVIGNAALEGAAMLLWDRKLIEKSYKLAAAAKTAELASDGFFMDRYVENMMF